jgi:hypothetical protein
MSTRPPSSADVRVRDAGARADRRLDDAVADLFLADDARLTDRARAAVHALTAGVVEATEAELRRHAARLLADRGAAPLAEALLREPPSVLPRLREAGLLGDRALTEELVGRVGLDLLAEALPPTASERPSLLVRLVDCPDTVVVAAATALLAAEGRRRTGARGDLPAELRHRLTWWVAAAIREQGSDPAHDAARDRALAGAAERSLLAHDEAARAEACAVRLAAAIDARPDELGPLLVEAIGDRQPLLFAALLARALGWELEQARELLLDPAGDLLLLALHAAGLERTAIARIGVALSTADPRRELEALADALDWAVAHDRETARGALATLALGRDFRAAVRLLARGR